MNSNEILVFPRTLLTGVDRFLPWGDASTFANRLEVQAVWLSRSDAEESKESVQAIPCALLRNESWRFYVLRRIRSGRRDLRAKVSLLVGGHVDRPARLRSVEDLLIDTLRRELNEELGLQQAGSLRPLGMLVDSTSISGSRHLAFVYEAVVTENLVIRATEEFSVRSSVSGSFLSANELSLLHGKFDPWSSLLFEDYIAPRHQLSFRASARKLPLFLDD